MTYDKTIEYIHSLMRFGSRPGLESISRLLVALGNPHKKTRFIHVAGTNGKGSTCSFISNILRSAGFKTGLYISPFVVCFNERIQINGEYISDDDLCYYTEIVKAASESVADSENPITEFEFITALAFCYFADKGCDVVVLEVGLGGRLDATNVIEKPLASVITKIDLDHTNVLGDSEAQIATEKCGIIKDNCPVITTSSNSDCVLDVICEIANKRNSSLLIANLDGVVSKKTDIFGNDFEYLSEKYSIKLIGTHQISNAILAITAVKTAFPNISKQAIKNGLCTTVFPARCEVVSNNPICILDGSHNPNGTAALNELLKSLSLDNAVAIVGFMADKDVSEAIKIVADRFSQMIAVEVESNSRSMKAEELKNLCERFCKNTDFAESYDEAIKKAISYNKPIVVFGSLYLAGDIRQKLLTYFSTKNN